MRHDRSDDYAYDDAFFASMGGIHKDEDVDWEDWLSEQEKDYSIKGYKPAV